MTAPMVRPIVSSELSLELRHLLELGPCWGRRELTIPNRVAPGPTAWGRVEGRGSVQGYPRMLLVWVHRAQASRIECRNGYRCSVSIHSARSSWLATFTLAGLVDGNTQIARGWVDVVPSVKIHESPCYQ